MVRVAPEVECGIPVLVARSAGGERYETGSRVGLVAHGEVRAWVGPATGAVVGGGADRLAQITETNYHGVVLVHYDREKPVGRRGIGPGADNTTR